MKKYSIFLLASMTVVSAATPEYLSIIKMNKAIIGGFTDTITTSEWSDTYKSCIPDKLEEDIYMDKPFNQINICNQNQERDVITTRHYDSGNSEELSRIKEDRDILLPDENVLLTGTHLEKSCNDIIKNNYSNIDGIYKIGIASDHFQVYCDMRINEGWTLVAKSPVGNTVNAGVESLDWFVNGQFGNLILNPFFSYNERMSAIGVDKINKISHTGLSEIQFISEQQDQGLPYYKTIINSNLAHWFKTTEPIATTVCTNKEMTANCESSAFEYWSNRYWLRGIDLRKHGFTIIDEVVQDVHYSRSPTYLAPTLCSVTGNVNNNAWHDTAADGHWGNGLVVYIK